MSAGGDTTAGEKKEKSAEEDTKDLVEDPTKVPVLTSCRLVTSYMCFGGMVLVFAARANIVMALVCMFPKEPDVEIDELLKHDANLTKYGLGNETDVNEQYNLTLLADWNDKTQGLALAAYNYGYLVSPILGGYVATKSAKYVLLVSMLVSAAATVVTPWTMTTHSYGTIALRVLIGICGGVYEPSMQHLISCWAPKQERGKLTALTQSGKVVGNVISFALSGVLCTITFLGGWPLPFYGTGVLCVIWSALVLFLVYDSPDKHPRISEVERNYIIKGLPNIKKQTTDKKQRTPWLKIMTSLPFIACLTIKFGGAWVFNVQTLNQPMWLRDVMKFDVTNNGLFSALPYIGQFIGSLLSGVILDAVTRFSCSTTLTRKITFCVCLIFPGSAIFSLAFLTHNEWILAICLTIFTTTIYSAVPVSLRLVVIEIAPRYTGILMGVVTTLGSIPGMVAPLVTSILTYEGSVDEWDKVFFMCSGMYVGAALFFLVFGSSKEQSWAGSGDVMAEKPGDSGHVQMGDVENPKSEIFETDLSDDKSSAQTDSVNSQGSDTESVLALSGIVPEEVGNSVHGMENPGFSGIEEEKSGSTVDHSQDTSSDSDRSPGAAGL